jgi:hypothetical protein
MRRGISLALIGCVIHIALAPALAMSMMACCRVPMAQAHAAQSHKMGAEHCHGSSASTSDSGASEKSFQAAPGRCSIRCCIDSHAVSKFALVQTSHALESTLATVAVAPLTPVFVSNGFSSHTDRGPPTV